MTFETASGLAQVGKFNFEIWDGDLFLYSVDNEHEANEAAEAGFRIIEPDIA